MDPFALREFLYVLSLEYRGSKTARILAALPPVAAGPGAAAVASAAANDPMTPTNTPPAPRSQGAASAVHDAAMPPSTNVAPSGSDTFTDMAVDNGFSDGIATHDVYSPGRGETEIPMSATLEMSPTVGRGGAGGGDEEEIAAAVTTARAGAAKEAVGGGMVVDILDARRQVRAPTS